MNVEQVKATIGEAQAVGRRAAGALHSVAAHLDELIAELVRVTAGTGHRDVTRSLSGLTEARERARIAEQRLRAGVDGAGEYLRVLG